MPAMLPALRHGIAFILTATFVATAHAAPSEPAVLDADGHLADAFLEEVRRQDEIHWMQQYTVNYTQHKLDYGFGLRPDDGEARVEERSGHLKANHETGASQHTERLDHAWPEPPGYGRGSSSTGASHYQCPPHDPFYWARRVGPGGSLVHSLTKSRANVLSADEEPTPAGVLLHIVTQRSDAHGAALPGASRREITLNFSRGYRPQRMVEHNAAGTARTETDIDLVRHERTGIWTASRVHEKVYDLREEGDRLRRETIYEFADLIRRTHLRIRF
ncbi:hypothetical protein HN371_17575 [Candidatus Poribacteria bacterium]|jgi:hypothetical protein|nr:hypothetical protein [Candidatus Poribacteria bacterium]MBT5712819.1 hypothetical protein [Candidatus Poribacteria bacterium]MBT7808844.1 hypothetical protein [Candidatus Poribacteria bacterium]